MQQRTAGGRLRARTRGRRKFVQRQGLFQREERLVHRGAGSDDRGKVDGNTAAIKVIILFLGRVPHDGRPTPIASKKSRACAAAARVAVAVAVAEPLALARAGHSWPREP